MQYFIADMDKALKNLYKPLVVDCANIFFKMHFCLKHVGFPSVRVFIQIGHVLLISAGMSLHQFAISGGFYFSHAEVAGKVKNENI